VASTESQRTKAVGWGLRLGLACRFGGLDGSNSMASCVALRLAGKVRIDERAGPRSVKIALPGKSHRQRGGPLLPLRFNPRSRRTVSNSPGLRMEVDGEAPRAGERVRAQMAVGLQLAGGSVQLQFAQIDRAVALGIGGIDRRRRRRPRPARRRAGEAEAEGRRRRRVLCRRWTRAAWRAVDAGVEAQALKGRLAHHIQKRVEGNVFELGRHLAVDRDGDGVGMGGAAGPRVALLGAAGFAGACAWLHGRLREWRAARGSATSPSVGRPGAGGQRSR
jgi:hypothetical protein